MAGWVGFSDAELRRMKQQTSLEEGESHHKPQAAAAAAARKQAQLNKQRAQTQKDRYLHQRNMQNSSSNTPQTELHPSQRLSQPKPESKPSQKSQQENKPTPSNKNPNQSDCSDNKKQRKDQTSTNFTKSDNGHGEEPKKTEDSENANVEEADLNEKEILDLEVSNMIKFQKQQKMIEEANKKKRQMLAQAIKERSQKAKAEASKLIQIEKELKHLDDLLTVDVSILRDKIEEASRDYTEAQKRYERLEREFIEAKVDLHKTAEMKEQLTEHLYSLIYQNEMRKSKKLSELTAKLELAELSSEEISTTLPDLPPLSMFSAVPAGQTLRSPTHVQHPNLSKQDTPTSKETTPTNQHDKSSSQKDVPTNQNTPVTQDQNNKPNGNEPKSSDSGKSDVSVNPSVVTTQPGENTCTPQPEKASSVISDKNGTESSSAENIASDSSLLTAGPKEFDTTGTKNESTAAVASTSNS
ncbi:RAB6-interacting golgin [Lingula anatina]|uniref:RAB6-interacting golgin n=1 Tax=Lingula anatina TaxID=7574 RepID=A0A1S3JVW9_LINAN|nr:RAB6-interacting golgin [Lingula anatina]|eukprot:XP_013414206.1 RAB6-interacting golgin [Lingula anatina]